MNDMSWHVYGILIAHRRNFGTIKRTRDVHSIQIVHYNYTSTRLVDNEPER